VKDASIAVRAYRVSASSIGGQTVGEIRGKAPRVSIEAVRRADRWIVPDNALTLEPGDEVVVGAPLEAQIRVREALGPELPDAEARSGCRFARLTSSSAATKRLAGPFPAFSRQPVRASTPMPCFVLERNCP
jgi:hypothetical protein